ncbi:MAG: hypothetical protein SFY32_15730 [Bacteroidota bacterium]|nr:hypothetical protein [Bacteroidota bacterium]
MTKYCLICIWLFGGYTINAQSILADEDSTFNTFYPNDTILCLEKAILFSKNLENKNNHLFILSEFYAKKKDHENAFRSLQKISPIILSDSAKKIYFYNICLQAYLSKKFAEVEGFALDYYSLSKDSKDKFYFEVTILYGFALNELNRWMDAHDIFIVHPITNDTLNYIKRINNIYDYKKQPHLKSSEKMNKIVNAIPAGPYFYTKNYKEGSINLALQLSGIGAGAYYVFGAHQYLTAAVLVYMISARFYLAAINKGDFLINKYNYKKQFKYNEYLRKEIKKVYKKSDSSGYR